MKFQIENDKLEVHLIVLFVLQVHRIKSEGKCKNTSMEDRDSTLAVKNRFSPLFFFFFFYRKKRIEKKLRKKTQKIWNWPYVYSLVQSKRDISSEASEASMAELAARYERKVEKKKDEREWKKDGSKFPLPWMLLLILFYSLSTLAVTDSQLERTKKKKKSEKQGENQRKKERILFSPFLFHVSEETWDWNPPKKKKKNTEWYLLAENCSR